MKYIYRKKINNNNNNDLLNLLTLAGFWGPTAMLMKLAMQEIHPITFIALSSIIACFALIIIHIYRSKNDRGKLEKLNVNHWNHCLIIGALVYSIPSILQCYAIKDIPSIWIGVTVAIIPVLTSCFAHYYLPNESLCKRKFTGLIFGLLGFLVLFFSTCKNSCFNQEIFSLILVLISILFNASGLIYAKKHLHDLPDSKISPILQFTSAFIYLIPIAIIFDNNFIETFKSFNQLFYITIYAIPCTALAYIFYYRLVSNSSAIFISMVNYILPLIKTLLGAFFLQEVLNLNFFIAFIFIFSGLFIANTRVKKS